MRDRREKPFGVSSTGIDAYFSAKFDVLRFKLGELSCAMAYKSEGPRGRRVHISIIYSFGCSSDFSSVSATLLPLYFIRPPAYADAVTFNARYVFAPSEGKVIIIMYVVHGRENRYIQGTYAHKE